MSIVSPHFDPEKHYLGSLCKRGHDYQGTGQSVRNMNNQCVVCKRNEPQYGDSRTNITKECKQCGRAFRPYYANPNQTLCSRQCVSLFYRGAQHWSYKDGRTHTAAGYVQISVDGKQVYEHRHVMEQHLGRSLRNDEHIHHLSGNKKDNRIENLQIVTNSEHGKIHGVDNPWATHYDCCRLCGTTTRYHKARGLCYACYNRFRHNGRETPPLKTWSKYYDECRECGTTDKPHGGHGLCQTCHVRQWARRRKQN